MIRTVHVFQCGAADLYGVTRDETGANLPADECSDEWRLVTTVEMEARISQMRTRRSDLTPQISVILQGSSRRQRGWRWTVRRVKKVMPPSGSRLIPA